MAAEYELTLTDYLSIARRRTPYIIGAFVVVLLATLIAVMFVPRTYQSTATILVESPQIAESLLPAQVETSVDERINNIQQRVLTRESLLNISNKYNLFKDSPRYLTSDDLVQKMRDHVDLELVNINTVQGARMGKATIAFTLSYEDKKPKIAYNVTKDLVDLFLALNNKLQTERATEATIFLTQAAARQKQEVDRISGLISNYQKQHGGAGPGATNLRMAMIQRDENELQDIDRESIALQTAPSGASKASPTSLPALKAELTRLSSIYNDSYPDIQALKLKIAALEKAGGGEQRGAANAGNADQTGAGSGNDPLEALAQRRKILQDRIARNEAIVMQTPEVAQGLDTLISESENAQKKYEDLQNQLLSAQMAEEMKRQNKADRFALLEPPTMPDKPFKPNLLKMGVLGFFLAVASSGGTLMAMVAFDNQIRGVGALEHVLGARPLAVIPYLVLQEEVIERKRKLMISIIASILALIAVALLIQFFYMPLGDLFTKLMVTFG